MQASSLATPSITELHLSISAISMVAPGGNVDAATRLLDISDYWQIAAGLRNGGPRRVPLSFETAIDRQRAKRAGISRVSSAPRATIYACLAGQAALESTGIDNEPTAVIAMSTTASLSAALTHEICGLANGWETVDPFLLPYAIPSAMATQVAGACDAHEGAICLCDGFHSFPHALSLAAAYLHSYATRVLIVAAEQSVSGLTRTMDAHGMSDIAEGAVAIVLQNVEKQPCKLTLSTVAGATTQHDPREHAATIGTSMDDMLRLCYLIGSLSEHALSAQESLKSFSRSVEIRVGIDG